MLKKAIELSTLCDQHIYLIIFDKERQKLVEYQSEKDFGSEVVSKLIAHDVKQTLGVEQYVNDNYSALVKERVARDDESKA